MFAVNYWLELSYLKNFPKTDATPTVVKLILSEFTLTHTHTIIISNAPVTAVFAVCECEYLALNIAFRLPDRTNVRAYERMLHRVRMGTARPTEGVSFFKQIYQYIKWISTFYAWKNYKKKHWCIKSEMNVVFKFKFVDFE